MFNIDSKSIGYDLKCREMLLIDFFLIIILRYYWKQCVYIGVEYDEISKFSIFQKVLKLVSWEKMAKVTKNYGFHSNIQWKWYNYVLFYLKSNRCPFKDNYIHHTKAFKLKKYGKDTELSKYTRKFKKNDSDLNLRVRTVSKQTCEIAHI